RAFIASTLVARCVSINGPFLVERAINSVLSFPLATDQKPVPSARQPKGRLRFLPTAHDECIGPLVVAGLKAPRWLAPRRHRMTSTGGLAFTTAMRVIDWIHRDAAIVRTSAAPAHTTCFANGDVLVIRITYLANGGHAVLQHLAGLT